MKLLEDGIKKNLELAEEFNLNKSYKKELWKFYTSYGLALAILEKKDPELEDKELAWRRFLRSSEGIHSKAYKELRAYMAKDRKVINAAMAVIAKINEASGFDYGEIDNDLKIGVLAFEVVE